MPKGESVTQQEWVAVGRKGEAKMEEDPAFVVGIEAMVEGTPTPKVVPHSTPMATNNTPHAESSNTGGTESNASKADITVGVSGGENIIRSITESPRSINAWRLSMRRLSHQMLVQIRMITRWLQGMSQLVV